MEERPSVPSWFPLGAASTAPVFTSKAGTGGFTQRLRSIAADLHVWENCPCLSRRGAAPSFWKDPAWLLRRAQTQQEALRFPPDRKSVSLN